LNIDGSDDSNTEKEEEIRSLPPHMKGENHGIMAALFPGKTG
jgi:hypothetical protein